VLLLLLLLLLQKVLLLHAVHARGRGEVWVHVGVRRVLQRVLLEKGRWRGLMRRA